MKCRSRKAVIANAKRKNPLRIDPTRTLSLRRSFCAQVKRQFAILRGRIVKLIGQEDALGLKQVQNSNPNHDELGRFASSEHVSEFAREWVGKFQSADLELDLNSPDLPDELVKELGKTLPTEPIRVYRAALIDELVSPPRNGIRSWTTSKKLAEDWVQEMSDAGVERKVQSTLISPHRILADVNKLGLQGELSTEVIVAYGKTAKHIQEVRLNDGVQNYEGQPRDDHGRFGDGHVAAALSFAKSLPAALYAKIKDKAQAKYAVLEKRYGSKWAKAIIGAAIGGLPLPVPGSSFLTAAPVVALAEMHRFFSPKPAVANQIIVGLPIDEVQQAAAELVEELREWALRDRELGELTENVFDPEKHPKDTLGRWAPSDSQIEKAVSKLGELKPAFPEHPYPNENDVAAPFKKELRQDFVEKNIEKKVGKGKPSKEEIPLSSLIITQTRVRKSSIEHMIREGHKQDYLQDRVIVVRHKGKNYLWDGTHRAAKDKLLGRKTVPAIVYGEKKPTTNLLENTRWQFHSSPAQVDAFQAWLEAQLKTTILSATQDQLWRAYTEAGYKKGAGRAFDDTRKTKRPELFDAATQGSLRDFYAGTKDEFLRSAFGRPESIEKVKLLASRSFDDLTNVTHDMSTKMSRALVDGLVEGKHPNDIADDLVEEAGLSETRALLVAQTEIIRAHAEGQLDAMDELGVAEVGVQVEFATANDNAVCPECAGLEGAIYSIDDAHGVIPVHPRCRCAFLPAGEPITG